MANNVVDILKGVVSELKDIARSETIIGEPVSIGKTTVVPVVKISVGFGAGGGQGEENQKSGFGGGGGGGARIEPAGFIIIEETKVRFLAAGRGKWDNIIDAIPGFAKKVGEWTNKLKSDKSDKSDKSEPETESNESEK